MALKYSSVNQSQFYNDEFFFSSNHLRDFPANMYVTTVKTIHSQPRTKLVCYVFTTN